MTATPTPAAPSSASAAPIATAAAQAALAAEHAAIFAYGRMGVLFDPAGQQEALAAADAHRARRDDLLRTLAEHTTPAPAAAGYTLPFPITDTQSAARLAVHVEEGVAAAWRVLLPEIDRGRRESALTALTDAAVRATRWRRYAGITPHVVPFPGRAT